MKDGIGFTIRCPGSHPGRVKKMTALFGARSRQLVQVANVPGRKHTALAPRKSAGSFAKPQPTVREKRQTGQAAR